MTTITKIFGFEMAHSLEGYDGDCNRIHGHSYRLWVTVSGEPCEAGPKRGMVVDFGVLKQIVHTNIISRFDHAFVVRVTDSNRGLVDAVAAHWEGVVAVDWQPTSENLVRHFAELLRPRLPEGVRLVSLRLAETESSYAELIL